MRLPDIWLFLPASLLSLLGLIVTYSIAPNDFFSQLMFVIMGLIFFILINQLDIKVIEVFTPYFYGLAILILILTLLIGKNIRGSTRWLGIGRLQFQTSEIIKPILILALCSGLKKLDPRHFSSLLVAITVTLVPAFLVFIQPDLGSSIIIGITGIFMLLSFRFPLKYYLISSFMFLITAYLVLTNLAPYQSKRMQTYLNPGTDPLGASYNQIQAIITVGSGQLFGKGLGKGSQSHLWFLPEKQTDFFFASLSEEFGFIGSFGVVLLNSVLLGRLLILAILSQDKQDMALFIGVFILLLSQTFIHIGINIGLLPVTGLPLPFLSVGGSSMVVSWVAVALASCWAKQLKARTCLYLKF